MLQNVALSYYLASSQMVWVRHHNIIVSLTMSEDNTSYNPFTPTAVNIEKSEPIRRLVGLIFGKNIIDYHCAILQLATISLIRVPSFSWTYVDYLCFLDMSAMYYDF